jgi:hypothetical protein
MALTISVSYLSETPVDSSYQGVIQDDTVYGAGNPARADGVLYMTGEKLNFDSSVDYEIDIETYDPTSVTNFTFSIEKDGWNQYTVVFIPEYNNGTTYLLYDAVYEAGVVYRATQNSFSGQTPPNSSYWEVISEPTSLAANDGTSTESANIAFEIFNIIIYPFAKKLFGDAAEDYAIQCCGTFKDVEEFTAYKELGAIVKALQASNTRSRYASGERISRYAASLTP